MPQVARTTSGITGMSAATLQGQINSLRSNMANGKNITASDINQLINIYNSWINHHHTSADLRGVDTFGNITTYTVWGTWVTATSVSAAGTHGFTPSSLVKAINNHVLAGDANEIVGKINAIRSHYHAIFDTTS